MITDTTWLFAVSVSVPLFIAITCFVALKTGIYLYKIIMDTVNASKGIEYVAGPFKSPDYDPSDDIVSLFVNYLNSFKKSNIKKNYSKYAYMQLFKK